VQRYGVSGGSHRSGKTWKWFGINEEVTGIGASGGSHVVPAVAVTLGVPLPEGCGYGRRLERPR